MNPVDLGAAPEEVQAPDKQPNPQAGEQLPELSDERPPGHKIRLRVRYSKFGKVRFISHRDVARQFERMIRKVGLPVAYSQGFSPRPRLSFGLALSVGYESDAEYMDIELTETVSTKGLASAMSEALPTGLNVVAVGDLAHGEASLQEAVSSCIWSIWLTNIDTVSLRGAVSAMMNAEHLPLARTRKGKLKTVDVRPAILSINIGDPTGNDIELIVTLATIGASLRPAELVELVGDHVQQTRLPTANSVESGAADAQDDLGADDRARPQIVSVRRLKQLMNSNGASFEPIAVPEPSSEIESANNITGGSVIER